MFHHLFVCHGRRCCLLVQLLILCTTMGHNRQGVACFTNAAINSNSGGGELRKQATTAIPRPATAFVNKKTTTTMSTGLSSKPVGDGDDQQQLEPQQLYTTSSSTSSTSSSSHAMMRGGSSLEISSQEEVQSVSDPADSRGPLKVLFLSADTGGGHRASAESLASQLLIHFPGSKYDLLDIWTTDGIKPYNTLVQSYKHLSAHPRQWRFLYHLSNSRPWEIGMDWHSNFTCERRIRKRIASYKPDVVISVHPAMNNTPLISLRKMAKESGKHIPFFTVVTDLGSGHCTWFHKTVDKLYVASDRMRKLAKRRGRTPDDKIVMTGLPIRHDFAVQADRMGDRTSESGREYVKNMKSSLGLDPDHPMVLVMGGGEGVGALGKIVDELYTSFSKRGVDATICVVCGRNEKLKAQLEHKNWALVATRTQKVAKRARIPFYGQRRRAVEIRKALKKSQKEPNKGPPGKVNVVGLGFITNMADYMAAADVLVTKAGPGTIAEAAAVGLPIMLTSYLPGQEAGNVDYVLEYGFGDYCEDPVSIAEEVASWLKDPKLLEVMSHRSQAAGHPDAASEIILDIGTQTQAWKALNGPSSSQ